MLKTLYINRPVVNAEEILAHYRARGFQNLCVPEDMHVTQIHSKQAVDWATAEPQYNEVHILSTTNRHVKPLGDKGAIVMAIESDILQNRFNRLLELGAKSDYPSYTPHITLTWNKPDFDLGSIQPFQGKIILGPEKMAEIVDDWRPMEKNFVPEYIVEIPMFIKAHSDASGRRIIRFECSNPKVDGEGDCILQEALLGSMDSFLKGNLDLDHISECGSRYGIANPDQYIVGKPTRVFDMGEGRTGVEGELFKGNPHADRIWDGLQQNPPQPWRASIYGFPIPGGIVDVRHVNLSKAENPHGATRYIVSKIHWKSTALTLNPVNNSITGTAQIVKSAAFMDSMQEIMKAYSFTDTGGSNVFTSPPAGTVAGIYGPGHLPQNNTKDGNEADAAGHGGVAPGTTLHMPRNRIELESHVHGHMAKGKCAHGGEGKGGVSAYTLKNHFMKCCGADEHSADIHALATMSLLRRH